MLSGLQQHRRSRGGHTVPCAATPDPPMLLSWLTASPEQRRRQLQRCRRTRRRVVVRRPVAYLADRPLVVRHEAGFVASRCAPPSRCGTCSCTVRLGGSAASGGGSTSEWSSLRCGCWGWAGCCGVGVRGVVAGGRGGGGRWRRRRGWWCGVWFRWWGPRSFPVAWCHLAVPHRRDA